MSKLSKNISGKLSPDALERSVLHYCGAHRSEVLIGPGVGEDAAVIEWPKGKYMIFASDPISGADEGAGRLLVRVNSNDIAVKGGDPAYIVITLILPPSFGEEGAERLMKEIDEECRIQGIAIAGGHTEFNDRYDRPVIMAALTGTADKVMRATDINDGDIIIATKHIGIEGMSILAQDRRDIFEKFMTDEEIAEVLSWSNETSVLADARAVRSFAKFMHDPTEGGFLGGIAEISSLCGYNAELSLPDTALHHLTRRASEKLSFNPFRLIASGSLVAVVAPQNVEAACAALNKAGINNFIAGRISGRLTEKIGEQKEELWDLLKKEID